MNNEEKVFQKSQINWYPGHMAKTKRLIKENYNLIDIVYEVIDARIPYSSKIKDIDSLYLNLIHEVETKTKTKFGIDFTLE